MPTAAGVERTAGEAQTRQTAITPLESPLISVSTDPAARVRTGWLWQYRAGAAVLRRPAPQTPVLHRRINYGERQPNCDASGAKSGGGVCTNAGTPLRT